MNESYRAQVRLMLDLLPLVAEETAFALKGGTAINFFVRDMPSCRSTSTSPTCRWTTALLRWPAFPRV